MNIIKRLIGLGLLSSLASIALAQDKLEDLNSGDVIRKGFTAYEDGKMSEAIQYLNSVPAGDTNFYAAQYELGLTMLADSQYDNAIKVFEEVAKNYPEEERQSLLNIGTCYSYKNEKEKALSYFDMVIKKYPNDNRPHYESGVVHLRNEDAKAAIPFFEKSLMLNPRHFRSHWLLGVAYLSQGRLSEAYIAIQSSLALTSNPNEAQTILNILYSIAVQNDMAADAYKQKKKEFSHPIFDETDELIHAKLALSKDYKVPSKFDNEVVRQLYVIFDQVAYNAKDKNFVMQFYIPFLNEIKSKNLFDSYVLYILSDYGIESIDKVAGSKKGKSKLTEIGQILNPYFDLILGTREINYAKRSFDNVKYFASKNDGVLVHGKPKDNTFSDMAEGYVVFYKYHMKIAEGNYDANGKKVGVWKYYYQSGKIKSQETNKDGKVTFGTYTKYYENGNIDYLINYDVKGEFKDRKDFRYNGMPYSSQIKLPNGDFEVTYYHDNGKPAYKKQYLGTDTKVQIDGPVKVLNDDGTVYKEYTLKNGKFDGVYKEYYENGKLKYDINYKDGEFDGPYLAYFKNGQADEKYYYKNGKLSGKSEDYINGSNAYFTQEFEDGQLNGSVLYYNDKKEKYGEVKYVKGVPVSSTFSDMNNKVVSDVADAKGLKKLELYNKYGNKISDIPLNDKGKNNGTLTRYFDYGGIRMTENYNNGQKNGDGKYYYESGKMSHSRQFSEGAQTGKYLSFTDAGEKDKEGWYLDDELQGTWTTYFTNGKPNFIYFMLDGKRNGPEKKYDYAGKLTQVLTYDKGMLVANEEYDAEGKVYHSQKLEKGEGQLLMKYPNGTDRVSVPLKYGVYHGAYKYFANDKTVLESGNYELGNIEGQYKLFHLNGNLYFDGKYKKGYREGLFVIYDPNGNVVDETNYDKGERNGISKVFSSGQLRYQFEYLNGERHGKTIFYGDQNKIAGIVFFDKGMLIGYSYLDKDGKEKEMVPIKNGNAKVQTYYASGEKAFEFNWLNNNYDGTQKLYYSDGKLAEERNFKKGTLEGTYKKWNQDGSLYYEVVYSKDRLHGTEKQYDAKGKLLSQTEYVEGIKHGDASIVTKNGSMKKFKYYYGTLTQ